MGVLNLGLSQHERRRRLAARIIKGLVLLVAVAFDVWNKRRSAVGGAVTTVAVDDGASQGMPDQDQVDELVPADE